MAYSATKKVVITINLSQNHLTIFAARDQPAALLRDLLLNHNLITGIIPKSYSKLTQLEEINLSHNRITGLLTGWKPKVYTGLHVAHNEWDDKILPQELYSLQETGQTDVWFNEDLSDPLNEQKVNGDGYNHPPIQNRLSGQMNAGAVINFKSKSGVYVYSPGQKNVGYIKLVIVINIKMILFTKIYFWSFAA